MPNNDYILRGDAISAYCGNCEATEVCRQIGEPCEEVKRIKAIPAADVEPKKKWIPVTERLPEDGTYLITWKNHNAQGVCMAYYGYYQDGLHRSSRPDFYRYDNEWGDVPFDDVTHWMPLPEPPKGEDNG